MDVRRRVQTIFQLETLIPYDDMEWRRDSFPVSQGTPRISPDTKNSVVKFAEPPHAQPQKQEGNHTEQTTKIPSLNPSTSPIGEKQSIQNASLDSKTLNHLNSFDLEQKRPVAAPGKTANIPNITGNKKANINQLRPEETEKSVQNPQKWRQEQILEFPPLKEPETEIFQPSFICKKAQRNDLQNKKTDKISATENLPKTSQDLQEIRLKTQGTDHLMVDPHIHTQEPQPKENFFTHDQGAKEFSKYLDDQGAYWLDDFTRDPRFQTKNQRHQEKENFHKAFEKWLESPIPPEQLQGGREEMRQERDLTTINNGVNEQNHIVHDHLGIITSEHIYSSDDQTPQAIDTRSKTPVLGSTRRRDVRRSRPLKEPVETPKLSIHIGELSIRQVSSENERLDERLPFFSLQKNWASAPGVLRRSTDKYTLQLPIGLV